MSIASEIALAIHDRLTQITVANGYLTDAGLRVFRGRRTLDERDVPCIVLMEDIDEVQDAKMNLVKLHQRYVVEAHSTCDPNNPNDKAHELLTDLKKAVFAGDKTFGGKVRNLFYRTRRIGPREDGSALVFASVTFDAEFSEDLTNP